MGRIRSIHPGQWTDEEFVECGPWARLLAIGLRNEADDNGIFEWKPVGLKMRLFPADVVDIAALLNELITANQIMRFEIDGRTYGAIRNFRIYQNPRSPVAQFPLTDEVSSYVGACGGGVSERPRRGRPPKNGGDKNQSLNTAENTQNAEINSVKAKSFPQNAENNSLMERRGEEKENNKHSTTARAKQSEPPGNQPAPSKNVEAVLRAANLDRAPPDTGQMLDQWQADKIEFDTVLTAIRQAERRNREAGGKPAYRMKFFDIAVRELHDSQERELEQWRKIAAAAKADPNHPPHPDELIAAGKLPRPEMVN